MTPAEIIRMRMRNERLTGVPFAQPAEVVSWMGAVQSQDYSGAKWALVQRSAPGVTSAQIDALLNAGKIIRTHVMRPTWHFVSPADLRWLLKLTAPRVHQVNAYMYRQLELDAAIFRHSHAAILKALRGGAFLTRDEIGEVLRRARIVASGHRLAYIMMHAELEGLICSGPLNGKQFTYALLEERVPRMPEVKSLDGDQALEELTRRFFTSHGPAQPKDFAWWSGLTLGNALKGLELAKAHLVRTVIDGSDYCSAPAPAAKLMAIREPVVHLLPNYDEFLGAFRDNRFSFDPAVRKRISTNSDVLNVHVVVLNGRVVGGWRRTVGRREIVLTTELLVTLSTREREALRDAAEAYGRFMELPVKIETRQGCFAAGGN